MYLIKRIFNLNTTQEQKDKKKGKESSNLCGIKASNELALKSSKFNNLNTKKEKGSLKSIDKLKDLKFSEQKSPKNKEKTHNKLKTTINNSMKNTICFLPNNEGDQVEVEGVSQTFELIDQNQEFLISSDNFNYFSSILYENYCKKNLSNISNNSKSVLKHNPKYRINKRENETINYTDQIEQRKESIKEKYDQLNS